MTTAGRYRRIVTGVDANGRSCVTIDGPMQELSFTNALIWRTDGLPADNSGAGDCPGGPFSFDLLHSGGTVFMVNEYQPGQQAYWHATDTIDYIAVLQGEVMIELEDGEARLRAGDFAVDRGVVHSWRNDGPEVAVAAIVTIPSHPVGKGRTE
jgi:hypothetical protein